MGSNTFLNYSLKIIDTTYKLLGIKMTNFLINKTVAPLFISGETIKSLKEDIYRLKKININSISAFIVEGLSSMDYTIIDKFYNEILNSIKELTSDENEGHYAIKFTALVTIDVIAKWSNA